MYKIPYGSRLFAKPDQPVKKGQKICEWDPYTLPVISETDGNWILAATDRNGLRPLRYTITKDKILFL